MKFEEILLLGFVIVVFGMLVIAYGIYRGAEEAERKTEGGGVVVIGPFPFAFGTSGNIAKIMMLIGIVIVLFFVFLSVLSFVKIA